MSPCTHRCMSSQYQLFHRHCSHNCKYGCYWIEYVSQGQDRAEEDGKGDKIKDYILHSLFVQEDTISKTDYTLKNSSIEPSTNHSNNKTALHKIEKESINKTPKKKYKATMCDAKLLLNLSKDKDKSMIDDAARKEEDIDPICIDKITNEEKEQCAGATLRKDEQDNQNPKKLSKRRGKRKNHNFGNGLTGRPTKNRIIRREAIEKINHKRLSQAPTSEKSIHHTLRKNKLADTNQPRKLSTTPTAVKKRWKRAVDTVTKEKEKRKTIEKDMTARLKHIQKEMKKTDELCEKLKKQLDIEKKKKRKAQCNSAESTRKNKKIKNKLDEQKEYVDQLLERL